MEVKVMIDLGFVKKDALQNVHDVKMVRGLGRGISHHPVVLCSVELVGRGVRGGDKKYIGEG